MAVFGVGGGLEKESAAMFSTAVSIIGLDMAIRSLAAKLRSFGVVVTAHWHGQTVTEVTLSLADVMKAVRYLLSRHALM
ncbi:hypothetical protein CYMTET_8483 [Cymbomonas tetramitiformis]|uniref:Uncharacterized protein n=1 Tax=Cymbomonas tetramitiformis TaxID=36881 RepID=A0AAE0GTN6_9CHLO|nr:hypothetical protein CYMTET_8483 [Cymbomonas tetramitiformis]